VETVVKILFFVGYCSLCSGSVFYRHTLYMELAAFSFAICYKLSVLFTAGNSVNVLALFGPRCYVQSVVI